jgi:hypothetical protein
MERCTSLVPVSAATIMVIVGLVPVLAGAEQPRN